MKTIYKYELEITDTQEISIPPDAAIFHCHMQGGSLCVWARTDSTAVGAPRTFYIFGTGHNLTRLPDSALYVGTAHDPRGFVWHVWVAP